VTGTLADLPRRRAELLAENALLRQQLIVLRTARIPNWKPVVQIFQPDMLLRWHHEGYRLFWRLKSRAPVQTQPQRLAPETIAWI
jgi:putative transposase